MTNILSKEERTQIVNSHKKNLAMNQYNLEISIIVENAKATPDQTLVANYNTQSLAVDDQLAALDEELANIAAE